MASGGPAEELREETTCPLCREHFQDPVTIDCGHSFCQICLIQYSGESDTGASCPQCRKIFQPRSFWTRWQRTKDAEKAICTSSYDTKLKSQGSPGNDRKPGRTEGGKGLCERHQKPLKFFCKDDQSPLYKPGLTQPASSKTETMAVPCAIMASGPPSSGVEKEVMCAICREDMADPVSVDCGHNFCRGCITEYCKKWQQMNMPLECPLCKAQIREENLRPNWPLKNLIENVKLRSKENLCLKHKKELNLFCKKDEELVCVGCERSPEHISHEVVLLEDAAQEYKKSIKVEVLPFLEKRRKMFVDQQLIKEQWSQKGLAELEDKKHKITGAFEQMHNFLEELQRFWLADLADLEKEMKKKQEYNIATLSQDIAFLSSFITDMEKTCQLPAVEFLKDLKNKMSSFENRQMGQQLRVSPDLDKKLRIFCQRGSTLEESMDKFEETLIHELYQAPALKPNVCWTVGPGLQPEGVLVKEAADFKVYARNGINHEKLQVTVKGPGLEVPVKQVDSGDGIYGFEYCPAVPGDYLVSITWDGQHIHHSPVKVKVRTQLPNLITTSLIASAAMMYCYIPKMLKKP